MKNRKLILIVSLVLAMTMSLGGTLAYLQDTDADVNTMVLGNVTISQNEEMFDGDELVEYKDKPALPAVYGDELATTNKEIRGEEFTFVDAKNVNDKIVTVTNKGNTDAYIRTIIAVEAPETFDFEALAHLQRNGEGIVWTPWAVVTSADPDNVRYMYTIATYQDKLAAKATSVPSLLQVFLDKTADNDDIAMLGEEWEIIALSQAVQADGFDSADVALNEAFDITELPQWLADAENNIGSPDGDKNDTNNPPVFEAANAEELKDLLATGADVVLTDNVTIDGGVNPDDSDLDLNGKELGADYVQYSGVTEVSGGTVKAGTPDDYSNIALAGSDVTFTDVTINSDGGGIGAIDGAQVTFNSGSLNLNATTTNPRYAFYVVGDGTEVTINEGTFTISALTLKRAYIYAGAGTTVYVNGGTFGKASTRSGYTAGILGDGTVIITGGTFGFNPSAWLAEGYEAVPDGTTWTVSKIAE